MSSASRIAPWRGWFALGLLLLAFPLAFLDWDVRALWPSVVAIGTALLLRKVLTGLFSGGLAGAIILTGGNPFTAFTSVFSEHLIPSFGSSWKVGAVLFTFIMGGLVALIEKGGGLRTLVDRFLMRGGDPARKTQLAGIGLGFVCFFDGLANSLMVGRILLPIARRTGVSRVKLAYIVDSTASAVACLAFVSTWIAYQLSMIREGYAQAGITDGVNAYALFFQSIPFNFYCWFTLALLVVVVLRRWHIGPMKAYEDYAYAGLDVEGEGREKREGGIAKTRNSKSESLPSGAGSRSENPVGWWRALVPVGALIAFVLGGIYLDGARVLQEAAWPVTGEKLAQAFGKSDAAIVMVWASAAAALIAFALYPRKHDNAGTEKRPAASDAFMEGVQTLFVPVLILLGAWILSSVLAQLEAAAVISRLLEGALPLAVLPVAIFLVGALISFSTGSSWGTMGILMPLAIPVMLDLTAAADVGSAAFIAATIGAVFSGAVFGDHCSPISDTTIVSSIACGVEPHDHVRTQIPYALIAGGLASLVGFVPVGLGLSPWVALPAGLAVLVTLPFLFPVSDGSAAEAGAMTRPSKSSA